MTHTAESLQAAFKYLFPDEVPALKQLAQSLPRNPVVVNIGAGSGTSGLAFMESRNDLWLVTIDIQKEDSPLGCLFAEEKVLRDAGLWNGQVSHLHGNSSFWGSLWHVPQDWEWETPHFVYRRYVNMVFIDGDHSYEGCKADIVAWLPNIKPGGIIAIHDYKKHTLYKDENDLHNNWPHPKLFPGIDKAVGELLLNKYEIIMHVDSLIAFRII